MVPSSFLAVGSGSACVEISDEISDEIHGSPVGPCLPICRQIEAWPRAALAFDSNLAGPKVCDTPDSRAFEHLKMSPLSYNRSKPLIHVL